MYSRASLLILDDCFSGIDPESESHIFTFLLGTSGILRRNGVTVILATHAVHRLSYADEVLVLSQDGAVLAHGSPETVLREEEFLSIRNLKQESTDKSKAQQLGPPGVEQIAERPQQDETDAMIMGRNIGDTRVYKHYFAAAGWLNVLGFFVAIAGFALFSRFSGEYLWRHVSPVSKPC